MQRCSITTSRVEMLMAANRQTAANGTSAISQDRAGLLPASLCTAENLRKRDMRYTAIDRERAAAAFDTSHLRAAGIDPGAEELTRLDAAILVHIFLREVTGLDDLEDISGAAVLKDLYDCRHCVNHIAQVYLRGIMDAVTYPMPGGEEILVFDGRGYVDRALAAKISDRIERLKLPMDIVRCS